MRTTVYNFHNTTFFLMKYFLYWIHNIGCIRSYFYGKAQTYKRNLRTVHNEKAQLMVVSVGVLSVVSIPLVPKYVSCFLYGQEEKMGKNYVILTSHLIECAKKMMVTCGRFYFFKYAFLLCSCALVEFGIFNVCCRNGILGVLSVKCYLVLFISHSTVFGWWGIRQK